MKTFQNKTRLISPLLFTLLSSLSLFSCRNDNESGNANTGDSPATNSVQIFATGQTKSNAAGDDGDLQKGVSWPAPRFIINNSTVTDKLTRLMWLQDGSTPLAGVCGGGSIVTWQGALDYVNCLNAINYLYFSDWRLPNTRELRSLVHYGEKDTSVWLNSRGFINVQGNVTKVLSYWSSESWIGSTKSAMIIGMGAVSGVINSGSKPAGMLYAWPVRNKSSLAKTGQATCFDQDGIAINCAGTGHDGDKQAGITWPAPRFEPGTDTQANCITDTMTGLMWPKAHNEITRTWNDALSYSQGLNLCGHTDWRLPNINEIASLAHTGEQDPGTWLVNQGFDAVSNGGDFWSSTSHANNTSGSWAASLRGNFDVSDKNNSTSVLTWPVRGE